MSNIEKDIKIIKYRVNKCREEFENFGEITFVYNDLDRIEHILAERKQDKARIKELEEENRMQRKQIMSAYNRGWIPKQKVKDKIEEIENAKRETTRENWHYIYSIQLEILEELLEESK